VILFKSGGWGSSLKAASILSFVGTEVTRNAYKILVGKPEGKTTQRIYRWEDSRIDLREIGWESVDWIHLAQNRVGWQDVVNTATNSWIPHMASQGGLHSMEFVCLFVI
jgi:hypothetical protein